MDTFNIVFRQLLQFFLVLVVGILVAKCKLISKDFLPQLSKLLTRVMLPILIFNSTYGDMTIADITEGLPVAAMVAGIYVGLAILFRVVSLFLPVSQMRRQVFQAVFMFGNTAMLATPLIGAVCPEKGKLYISFLLIVDTLFLWTYGVRLVSSPENRPPFRLSSLISPALIAIFVAFAMMAAGIELPEAASSAVSAISSATTTLCLMYLGMLFYFSNVRGVLKCPELYVGLGLKMLAVPILFGTVLQLTSLDAEAVNMLIIVSGLPTVTIMPLFAETYGTEGAYATGITMISVLVSMASLPIVAYFAMA